MGAPTLDRSRLWFSAWRNTSSFVQMLYSVDIENLHPSLFATLSRSRPDLSSQSYPGTGYSIFNINNPKKTVCPPTPSRPHLKVTSKLVLPGLLFRCPISPNRLLVSATTQMQARKLPPSELQTCPILSGSQP